MSLCNLYANHQGGEISTALIGVGHFGIAIFAQALKNSKLRMAAIADRNPDSIQNAMKQAGCTNFTFCSTLEEAQAAYETGSIVAVTDATLLFSLPVTVILEATGNPEAGARHALLALESGKHLVMVTKETDSCVGPILKQMADEKGLVYTPVDGDQHGALMQMVDWAREIGLQVICGGKSRDAEFIYDHKAKTVTVFADNITVHKTITAHLTDEECQVMEGCDPELIKDMLIRRKQLLKDLDPRGGFDLCEMVIAANATGLVPDTSLLYDCILRTPEIPTILCSQEDGGILKQNGIIEVVTNLHETHEAGLGGGVFITVHCDNDYSQMILATKGCLSNPQGTISMIYQPWHLCGVESLDTALCVGIAGVAIGARTYRQDYDLVQEAAVDLKAGDVLGNDHDVRMLTHILPAQPMAPEHNIPAHMLNGRTLLRDVPKGQMIRYCDVDLPEDSALVKLRRLQDNMA